MDPEVARRLIADEPRYDMTFGEGRACALCGSNVLPGDREAHTRWHRAVAEVLGLGWEDLATRRPATDEVGVALAAAVEAVVHPRGWARVSRLVTAQAGWRSVPAAPLGEHGTATLLLGAPGVVVARAAGTPAGRVEVRGDVVHVDGHRGPHADELGAAVRYVRDVLTAARNRREPLPVVGVLVALGTLEGRDPDPPDVLVASATSLPDRLAMLPEALGQPELDLLWNLVRRSTTWR
jgi:hypothetical protein